MSTELNSGTVGGFGHMGPNDPYNDGHSGSGSSGGSVITDVADGTISASSKDAVNGSQLKATNDDVEANTANIATNTSNIATNTANIATNTTNLPAPGTVRSRAVRYRQRWQLPGQKAVYHRDVALHPSPLATTQTTL